MDPITIGVGLTVFAFALNKGGEAVFSEPQHDTFCYEYVHKGVKGQRCMAVEIENPTSASGNEPARVTVYWDEDSAH